MPVPTAKVFLPRSLAFKRNVFFALEILLNAIIALDSGIAYLVMFMWKKPIFINVMVLIVMIVDYLSVIDVAINVNIVTDFYAPNVLNMFILNMMIL